MTSDHEAARVAEGLTPVRVQLRRTKGWRMPENTVKVDRHRGSLWGNPITFSLVKDLAIL